MLEQPSHELAFRVHLRLLRVLGQSDGGSAFDQFQPGIAKVRSSGDPLIELLAFCFLNANYPTASRAISASAATAAIPSR